MSIEIGDTAYNHRTLLRIVSPSRRWTLETFHDDDVSFI